MRPGQSQPKRGLFATLDNVARKNVGSMGELRYKDSPLLCSMKDLHLRALYRGTRESYLGATESTLRRILYKQKGGFPCEVGLRQQEPDSTAKLTGQITEPDSGQNSACQLMLRLVSKESLLHRGTSSGVAVARPCFRHFKKFFISLGQS
jgi:hypothetical protein